MNESSAMEVTLLQAFETTQPSSAHWTADDAAWATRLANSDMQGQSKRAGPSSKTDDESYIARRAHHAMQRLLPREAMLATWLQQGLRARASGGSWLALTVLATCALGLLADSIGSAQRINLLAPPLWLVLLWNALVYLLLMGQWVTHRFQSERRPGAVTRWAQQWMQRWTQRWTKKGLRPPRAQSAGHASPALSAFAALWMRRSAPLALSRAAVLLHAGSAALALGLIGGMYLRGLVLDYRASWESTFLSAQTAHAALSILLYPAAAAAHIELPNLAAFEALRDTAHYAPQTTQSARPDGGSGAAWIHLYAVTLGLFVVLPRTLLMLCSALRVRWKAQHIALPWSDEYFARLLRQRHGREASVRVVPYASAPSEQALAGLRAALAQTLGAELDFSVAAAVAYGAQDDASVTSGLPVGTSLAVALFDLTATPEAENHGRFVQQLAALVSTLAVIDESGFQRRFAATPQRLSQRQDAWRAWAGALGTQPVFVNLDQPDLRATERDLLAALHCPVRTPPA